MERNINSPPNFRDKIKLKKKMKNGINLKQFNKWIKKNVGKRCPDFAVGCLPCQSWEVYDTLSRYLDGIEILEDPNQGLHKKDKPQ